MAKQKTWTSEDRDRALQWLGNKGVGMFRQTVEAAGSTLERLGSIEDLSEFGRELEAVLIPEAWRKLLATLRSRKCQADRADRDQGDTEADQGDKQQGACKRCSELEAVLADMMKQRDEDSETIIRFSAMLKNEREMVAWRDAELAKLQAALADQAATVDHHQVEAETASLTEKPPATDHPGVEADQGDAAANDHHHQVEVDQATEIRALVLAMTAQGKTIKQVIGALFDSGIKTVDRDAIEAMLANPLADTDRDALIIEMHRLGAQNRPAARVLGISDGTVRNVLRRHGIVGQQAKAA